MYKQFSLVFISCIFLLNTCAENSGNTPMGVGVTPSSVFDSTIEVNEEVENGISLGNVVVEAIERYYDNEGSYPETLSDLVPRYMNAIPTTGTNQEFKYLLLDTENILGIPYNLSFNLISNVNTACVYRQKHQTWDCSFYIAPDK